MRNLQIFQIVGAGMVLAALIANHAAGRVQPPQLHQLPVRSFPRQIGEWKAGPDNPVDPDVQHQLSTAIIVDRDYKNIAGDDVDLVLITADRTGDLHNPKVCLPDQGWQLSEEKMINVGDQPASFMVAGRGQEQLEVLYWLTGQTRRGKSLPLRFQSLRAAVIGIEGDSLRNQIHGYSLFVRLIAVHTPSGHQALLRFANQILEPLKPIVASRSGAAKARVS
jgi:EpsI family protein